MIEQELINIWKSSPEEEQVKFEKSRLMIDVKSNLDRFHKAMKWLYLREALGAFIAIPAFTYFVFDAPHIISKVGALLICIWAFYILYVIKKTRKLIASEYSVDFLLFLNKTKAYLELQMKLRHNIFFWYALPFMVFCYLFMLGFILEKEDPLIFLIGAAGYCLIIAYAIHVMNRRSANKFVKPKLEKVTDLIDSLKE